ncbi:IPT/TIG domain-containing protein [Pontibacter sp. FD36]|uniref:IPT/TIG domain-containing protein n=1 Tax=Pontibacter sp. FD36 TaxID=2789860 RepID=UPI0018AC000D|nr:IPT/TIG domain-containing protein [Pontibacter sp. FD36]MBF8963298.1 IPT/TIG domain-containing protein [Pontibacter sp. FD36]
MRVAYSVAGAAGYTEEGVFSATTVPSRDSVYLPSNATNVRFQRIGEGTTPYLFLDAIEVSQQPEFGSFSPAFGVPGTEVTIKGVHLDETSQVFFGAIAATLNPDNISSDQIVVNVPTGAVSGSIKVVTPYGEASSATDFEVPAPEFADAEFTAEPAFSTTSAGPGDEVTLNGRYFTGVTGVKVGGVDAAYTFEDGTKDTRLTITIPLAAVSGPITVTTPAGTATSTEFTVLGPQIGQVIEEEGSEVEFTPATGAVDTEVTIYGKYFLAATDVFFNGVPAEFDIVSDNEITATVPLGASTGIITVKSAADEGITSTEFALPAPAFADYNEGEGIQFEPTSAGPGMQIVLWGTNLASASQVVFLGDENDTDDDREVAIERPLTRNSNTRLVVQVPADAKTGRIRIDAPGLSGTIVSVESEQTFTFVAAPTIASVANTTGDLSVEDGQTFALVGDEVTITGTNFETATTVTIGNATVERANDKNVGGFAVINDGTQIVFTVPATITESTGIVKVNTLGGEAIWDGTFDVILAPDISAVEPLRGPRGGKITLTGSNLKYVSEVVFVGESGTPDEGDARVIFAAPNASDTELKFVIPANAETGELLVINPADETETAVFTIVRSPEVLAITPTEGAAGTAVTMTGYNFLNEVEDGGATTVTFVGEDATAIPAANLQITSDSTMTFNVPAGAITGVITVANNFGSDASGEFFIYQLPTITSFTPARGIVGNEVEITGTNFYAQGMVVTFLGDENDEDDDVTINVAPTAVNVQDQKITVTVPSDAVTGKLMVTNTAGDSAPSTGTYEVVRNPEIISFTPNQGKAATPATVVTITGWLLNQGVTAVDFNGAEAAATYNPDGTLTVTVPTGAQTGRLTLIVNGERGHSSTEEFTVIPEPSIYSFNPTSGVGGTEVTIIGTNFEGITGILFNEAEVEDVTSIVLDPVEIGGVAYQQFTVNVPADATTGPITIIARGGTVESEDDFVVPVPANITFTPNESYADQLVTISGKYFTGATEVDFNGKKITEGITVVDAPDEDSNNPERIQQIIVAAPFDAGVGPIAITTPAGTGTSTGNYTVIEPVITSTTLREGYADRTVITIEGINFTKFWNKELNGGAGGEDDARPIVEFQGLNSNQRVAAVVQDGYTNTSVTVTVPPNARSGGITVRSGSGTSVPYYFEVLAPTVSSVSPTAVYAKQRVTVTGTNYVDVLSLSYGGVSIPLNDVTGYRVVNETTIEFVAPEMPAGSNNRLIITTESGSVTSTLLTVYKPVIASVVNDRVYAGVSTVTITGTRFDEYYDGDDVNTAVPTVTFAGTGSARIAGTILNESTYSSTETGTDVLVVAVPSDAQTGTVHVTSRSGTGVSSTVTVIGAPTITSLSPTSSLVNTTLTIKGTNLDQATSVTFLGRSDNTEDNITVNSDAFISNTSEAITLNVPANAVAGRILVTTPRTSGNTATSANVFRIVKAPVITSIDETEQQALQTITLNGANLWDLFGNNSGNISVWFEGHGTGTAIPAVANRSKIPARVVEYDQENGDWVTVEVPRDAITGVIEVQNAAGSTTWAEFTVTSPVIVRFEKADGSEITSANPARINETVLIRGYQLEDIGVVRVGDRNILSFTEVDPTTVRMVVRQGARTGPVVITSLGYEETSAPVELHIARPTITVSKSSLTFDVVAGETSEMQEYTVSASYLAVGELDVNLALPAISAGNVPNNFEMSLTGEDGTWGRSITLTGATDGTLAPTTIYVRSNPPAEAESDQNGVIIHGAFDAASVNVTLNSRITPLPVELIAFNATKQGNGVQLTWATASELDNDYFEVQMTEDLKGEFKAVGKVNSEVNTTALRQDYQFNHKGNFNGTRYYRLKQVDLDGTFEYSKVVAVSSNGVNLAVGPRVYPNPINADSKLVFNADRAGKLNVRIVNMNGSAVQNLSYDIEEGENTIILNLNNNLPTGIYILMTEFNGKTEQVKLLKQ